METQHLTNNNSGIIAALNNGKIQLNILPKEILVLETVVAGTSFTSALKFEKDLKKNMDLQLMREPKNKFDEFAIGLFFKGKKIGYIPRDHNEVIARLLDAGKPFTAKLKEKEFEGNWLRLEVSVYLKD
jgi:HIRAN domain